MPRPCDAWAVWRIPTDHFDPAAARLEALARRRDRPVPLGEILVEHSTFSRSHLKKRLYAEGLKVRRCEQCGQNEEWRGRRMSLILDHVNGRATDNRLENLQIVCPNCAATLDTHCGRMLRRIRTERSCETCGRRFYPDGDGRRYCSHACFAQDVSGRPRPQTRKVKRPPYAQLRRELAESSWCAVGRRYSVSDNAVRKWIRLYERAKDE